ncbi:MAG: transglutaminase-like domain-containing protein [Bacteroidales bacterium]|nr:transglutaminase-like domain-containing protein [Bacteroidales bacterium]
MDSDTKIREMEALVSLVDDPDLEIFRQVSEKLHDFGPEAIPFLQKAWDNCFDPLVQNRIEMLMHQINFDHVVKDLSKAFEKDCKDLLSAWISLSRYHYPGLNEEDIQYEMNQIRKDIWLELNENLTALEQIKVFNHVFFDVHGFSGNLENYHAYNNSYVNQVLHSRKGNPLSLSTIYLLIAQSLDLPVFGVNLPEHFVLAYTGKAFDTESMRMEDNKVLFYINPFSRGMVFSAQEVEKYIRQLKLEPLPAYYEPCSNSDIVLRMINNLVNAYENEGKLENKREMEHIRAVLRKKTKRDAE